MTSLLGLGYFRKKKIEQRKWQRQRETLAAVTGESGERYSRVHDSVRVGSGLTQQAQLGLGVQAWQLLISPLLHWMRQWARSSQQQSI